MGDSPQTGTAPESQSTGTVRHGYPPPARPAGTRTTAYCGVTIVVEGVFNSRPPADTCPLCALVWEQRHRR